MLESDEVRRVLTVSPTYSEAEREEPACLLLVTRGSRSDLDRVDPTLLDAVRGGRWFGRASQAQSRSGSPPEAAWPVTKVTAWAAPRWVSGAPSAAAAPSEPTPRPPEP